MATGLGLTVGATNAIAVDDTTGNVVVAPTGLALDGAYAALLPQTDSTQVVVTGYANRVGDPVALVADDGNLHTGEDLVATTMRCLADAAAPDAATVAVAHPATWTRYQQDVLAEALAGAGLADATLVTEPQAAATWLRNAHPELTGLAVVVYDLGATSLDVTVVNPSPQPEILGQSLRSEDYSGTEFDHATMHYVVNSAPGAADAIASASTTALHALRTRCREAREALSADTATVVAIDLPDVTYDIRLVREELEDLVRGPLTDSVALVHEAIRGAGLDTADIGAVLLTGGCSATPLVAETLSSALRVPVVADTAPAATAARGAATIAAALPVPGAVAATDLEPEDAADSDTVAIAMGPAPSAPASIPTPTPGHRAPTHSGMPTSRKVTLVTAAVAALGVLTAGGLSLGNGTYTPEAGNRSGAATTTGSSPALDVITGSVAPTATPSPGIGTTPTADGVSTGGSHQVTAVNVAATAGTPTGNVAAPATPGTQSAAPAPAAPATQAPAPVDNPPNTGNGNTNAGEQAGAAAAGVGQGVGNVLSGVGQGVGGVVGGVGQGLGGVVGGVFGGR